jgi:formyl-CoA transferase
VAQRIGLDYEALSARNPRLVYCENTAFGQRGPYSRRAGYDILSQATTGMILHENKIDRGVPQTIQTLAVADLTTGMFMAFAIANALYARERSGRGQLLETSLFASGIAAQYRPVLSIERFDAPVREGFLQALAEARSAGVRYEEAARLRAEYIPGRGRNNYYRVYETRDGLIAVGCLNNGQRRRLRDALGIDDPSVDGRSYDWFSEEVRAAHRRTIDQYEETFRGEPTALWLERLDAADVPCSPVNFPEEIFANEHVRENELVLEVEHPVIGPLLMPACPIRMSDTPPGSPLAPPALGADGADIMRELGYDDEAVAGLLDAGVLVTRERLLAADGEDG